MSEPASLYIEISPGERRAALTDETGRIVSLSIDRDGVPSLVGMVCMARVSKIEPGLGAAFLDLGPIGEAMLSKARGLTEGQSLPVQIIRDGFAGKGPAVSQKIIPRGRYLSFDPSGKGNQFAAALGQGKRHAQAEALARSALRGSGGFAVHGPASEVDEADLSKEAERLRARYNAIITATSGAKTGEILEPAQDFVTRQLMDVPPGARVAIDDRLIFAEVQQRAGTSFPDLKDTLAFYDDRTPLFEACGAEDALETALARQVPLVGGGRMTIDRTEALWAIDVDSGSATTGQSLSADAAAKLNRRAAGEIARQIRLRNMAGLIVVDFASMPGRGKMKEIADVLKGALRKTGGPTICDVLGVSAAGLVEVTRQRVGPALHELMLGSRGHPIPLPAAEATAALRAALRLTGAGRPVARLSPEAIALLDDALASAKADADRRLGHPLVLETRSRPAPPDVRLER